MTRLLDAALIVKDEEHHLPDCLAALQRLRPVLGEICVYDTGSTDRTVEICERAGCRVQRGHWDGDFARARNAASAMTDATWVLHCDADETVIAEPSGLQTLLERATFADFDVLYYPIRSWDRGRPLGDAAIGRLVRAETTMFVGRVHEHAARRDGEPPRGGGVPSDLLLAQHVGYSGEGTLRRKSERNAKISDAEVRACRQAGAPESELQLALIHRARARYNLGDNEGARNDLLEVRALPTDLGTRRYAGQLLADHALVLQDWPALAHHLRELAGEGVDRGWLRWKTAHLVAAQGDPKSSWQTMTTIDNVATALGETVAPAAYLRDRVRFAIEAGAIEDAVATALVLVTRHGRTEYVPLLLEAWAAWPPVIGGEMLAEGFVFGDSIRAALVAHGVAADAIREAFERSLAAGGQRASLRLQGIGEVAENGSGGPWRRR